MSSPAILAAQRAVSVLVTKLNRHISWQADEKKEAAGAALLVPLVLFLHTFSPAPLPAPKPYAGTLPIATPPKEMAVFALVAGVNHRVAAFGYRGGRCSNDASFRWPERW